MSEFEQFATEVVALVQGVKDHCDAELRRRDGLIADLRAQIATVPCGKDGADGADGRDGKDGIDGKDGAPGVVGVHGVAGRDGASGMDGRDGQNGADGKPGERGEKGEQGTAGRDGNHGRDGRDGEAGKPGERGERGADAVIDVDQVVEALKSDPEAVQMLRGERGLQGDKGTQGDAGRDASPGKDGRDGKDAAPVTPEQLREAAEHRFATWALEFERLATDRQRAAIDSIPLPRDGRDGKDGRNGTGLDDFDIEAELVNERSLSITIRTPDRSVTRTVELPIPIDRGVYRQSARYERGDCVSYGGQMFIAQKATEAKPGESGDWRLAVRRGKDGKDAGTEE